MSRFAPRHWLMQMQRLRADSRGIALVEFAMVAPFLILLYLGGFEMFDGIACSRKTTVVTRAMADLVAQNVKGTTTKAEVDSDIAAAGAMYLPYKSTNAVIRVSEIMTDANLHTTVQWSRASNNSAYTPGANFTPPTNIQIANSYYIIAEVTYAYKSPINYGVVQPLTLSDHIYMVPRNTSRIDCSDC